MNSQCRSNSTYTRTDAPLNVGAGRTATVTESTSGVTVTVLATTSATDGAQIRVTRPAGALPSYVPGTLTAQFIGTVSQIGRAHV